MSYILILATRYLWVRKTRTLLTTLAIVFGVMIYGLNGTLPAITESFRLNLMSSLNQVDLTASSKTRGYFSENVMQEVKSVEAVAAATGLILTPLTLPPDLGLSTVSKSQAVKSVMLNGIDPQTIDRVRPWAMVSGAPLACDNAHGALITESLAGKTGLGVGSTIRLPSSSGIEEFAITGIVRSSSAGSTEPIYVLLSTAQKMLDRPGQINTIEAMFVPGSDIEGTRKAVLDQLGDSYELGGVEAGGELMGILEMGDMFFLAFGLLAMAMGAFIIFITFRTVIVERRKDIGMLRALGASRAKVLGVILVESLVQGVIGTLLGLGAGYLLVMGMLAAIGPFWESEMHIPLGEPSFSLKMIIMSVFLGVGGTLLGGIYPAVAASRIPPLEALRPVLGTMTWKAARKNRISGTACIILAFAGLATRNTILSSLGLLLLLVGLVLAGPLLIQPFTRLFGWIVKLVFPREGHLAQGNLLRQPGRVATTAMTMSIGLAILVALAGLTTSMTYGAWKYVNRSLGADYLLMPQSKMLGGGNVGASPELAHEIQRTPGIATVTTLRMGTARVGETDIQVIGINPVTYPQVAGLEFLDGNPQEAYQALMDGRSMIANGLLATENKLEVGQEIMIQTPTGDQKYRIAGVGSDYLNMKMATGFISQKALEQDFSITTDLMLMADRAPDANPDAVYQSLERISASYPAFTLYSADELRASQKEEFDKKTLIVYFMVIILAVPSLIALVNTLSISVMERTREIGMLRAIGANRKQVRNIILGESLLLSIAGAILGISMGLWLGYIIVKGMELAGFQYPYTFPTASIWVGIAAALLIGLLGALLPARHAARMNILSALRYE